ELGEDQECLVLPSGRVELPRHHQRAGLLNPSTDEREGFFAEVDAEGPCRRSVQLPRVEPHLEGAMADEVVQLCEVARKRGRGLVLGEQRTALPNLGHARGLRGEDGDKRSAESRTGRHLLILTPSPRSSFWWSSAVLWRPFKSFPVVRSG